MRLGSLEWAFESGCFTFTGGTIIIDGNQTDILNQCWFLHDGAQANYDAGTDETTITAGGTNVPECTNDRGGDCDECSIGNEAVYIGEGASGDWTDFDNWLPEDCGPSGRYTRIEEGSEVDAATDTVRGFAVGGGSTLTVDGITLTALGGPGEASTVGTAAGQGDLIIEGTSTVLNGDAGLVVGGSSGSGHVTVRGNGTYDGADGA